MGIYKLLLPKMGESVSEATITKWIKEVGDAVAADEAVVEIATDKVDSDVPSPVSGRLVEKLFEENQVARVGDAIALLEVSGEETEAVPETESTGNQQLEEEKIAESEEPVAIPGTELLDGLEEKTSEKTVLHSTDRFYSPLVKNIAQEEGLSQTELDGITGTGLDGRVTKQDVLAYLADRNPSETVVDVPPVEPPPIISEKGKTPMPPETSPALADRNPIEKVVAVPLVEPLPIAAERQKTPPQTNIETSMGDEIVEMDRMRRLIADHMVQSVKTAPHVASFVEADVTNLVAWRNRVKDGYRKREGENITFTPIFLEAIGRALRDFPMVNVSLDGHNIIKKKEIHIGMATALPSGNLIVPVIKNADRLNLAGLTKAVNDLAERARSSRLKPDDTQGGTFTFTNIGAFGNITGIPIIHQPQSAILAAGIIKKRPAVLETAHGDVIAIRHIVYLSMSYDHRIIDGALGGTFLKRVADYLENWDMERAV